MAVSDDAVWVTSRAGNELVRVDPATNAVVARVPVGTFPVWPALAPDGTVWVPNNMDNTVSIVDPATNTVVRTIAAGPGPTVINQAFGDM